MIKGNNEGLSVSPLSIPLGDELTTGKSARASLTVGREEGERLGRSKVPDGVSADGEGGGGGGNGSSVGRKVGRREGLSVYPLIGPPISSLVGAMVSAIGVNDGRSGIFDWNGSRDGCHENDGRMIGADDGADGVGALFPPVLITARITRARASATTESSAPTIIPK
jgi:hypothetical protein